jgi:hypothetical protein
MADSVRSFSAFGQQCQRRLFCNRDQYDSEITHYLTRPERISLISVERLTCLTPRSNSGRGSTGWPLAALNASEAN